VNVLQQLRAAVAQEGASTTPPVPTPAPSPAAPAAAPLQPCPFTFGDWLPRTDPQAHPGEAQRAVLLGGAVVAWWRREWVPPLPIPSYSPPLTLEPYQRNAIYLPDGSEAESSCCPQTALQRLAARLGA
jgi:hypothetical protein